MPVLISILPNFGYMLHYGFIFVARGGWVLFVVALVWMLWVEYLEEIQGQFVDSTPMVFLEIKPPKENRVSTMAVENIFTQLHALHTGLTLEERFVQGKIQLWYSMEIVSLGGRVSFLLRTPKRQQHLVESAFYSQYPGAEIREVGDYIANYNYRAFADDNETEMFGTEWKMSKSDVIPIKTYKDFEHPSAEEKVIDPLSPVIEAMERVKPREIMAIQILIRPAQNDEWEGKAIAKIKELTGEEMPHKPSFWGLLMKPFEWFAHFSYKETLLGGGHGHGHEENANKQRNNWMSMTEGEKEVVSLIEKKVNKANFRAKIRILYIAPKDEFDKARRADLVGALRHFSPGGGSGIHNTIKPNMSIWTKVDPMVSETLEKQFTDHATRKRKFNFLRGYKKRSLHIGGPAFLLSVEELASLYHFPITPEGTLAPANVQAVESKKTRPPANLPVAE